MLEQLFKLSENETTVRTEVMAGLNRPAHPLVFRGGAFPHAQTPTAGRTAYDRWA